MARTTFCNLKKGDTVNKFIFVDFSEPINGSTSGIFTCWRCNKDFKHIISRVYKGYNKACGCLKNVSLTTHSCSKRGKKTPTYNAWCGMRKRCLNKNYKNFNNYGGRGISICDRWLLENGFVNFLADMGERPSIIHSLDRKNNNGNYEPSNCRWATKKEQDRNRRSNIIVEYNGENRLLIELAEQFNISDRILRRRVHRDWPLEIALKTPVYNGNKLSTILKNQLV